MKFYNEWPYKEGNKPYSNYAFTSTSSPQLRENSFSFKRTTGDPCHSQFGLQILEPLTIGDSCRSQRQAWWLPYHSLVLEKYIHTISHWCWLLLFTVIFKSHLFDFAKQSSSSIEGLCRPSPTNHPGSCNSPCHQLQEDPGQPIIGIIQGLIMCD